MFQNWGSSLSPHVLFVQGCHHFFLFLLELPLKIWEPEKNILNWLVLQVFQGHPQIRSLHGKIFARLVKSSVNQYVACQPKTAGYIFLYIYMCMFCLIHIYIHSHFSNCFFKPVVGNQSLWNTKPGSFKHLSTVKHLIFKNILYTLQKANMATAHHHVPQETHRLIHVFHWSSC